MLAQVHELPQPFLLCENCRHMTPDERCGRTFVIDYVHGKHRQYNCSTERSSTLAQDCGPTAQFWAPKDSRAAADATVEIIRSARGELPDR